MGNTLKTGTRKEADLEIARRLSLGEALTKPMIEDIYLGKGLATGSVGQVLAQADFKGSNFTMETGVELEKTGIKLTKTGRERVVLVQAGNDLNDVPNLYQVVKSLRH